MLSPFLFFISYLETTILDKKRRRKMPSMLLNALRLFDRIELLQ